MTTKLDDISEAIGQLRAEVKNLGHKIDQAERHTSDSNRRADEHRTSIHRRVDELVGEVSALTTEVATMKDDVKESKEVTDKVRQWEQRGIGALFVAGIAGTALGGAVAGFLVYWWDGIMRLLRTA